MAELRVMFGEIQATENGSECCAVLEEFDGVDEYDQIDAVCIMLTEDDYDTPSLTTTPCASCSSATALMAPSPSTRHGTVGRMSGFPT